LNSLSDKNQEVTNTPTTHLLIKVNILKIDFYDNEYEKKNLFLKKISSIFPRLFDSVRGASGSYDFSPYAASLQNYGCQNLLQ